MKTVMAVSNLLFSISLPSAVLHMLAIYLRSGLVIGPSKSPTLIIH